MKNHIAAACALACLHALPVSAEESSIEPVVVTATRTARTVDDTLASVTVLSRKDIERSQAKSVPELLRAVPGAQLGTSGGYGKQTSMFLRGTNSNHVLVLIDGLRVGSVRDGAAAWSLLPIDQIERIEIVRGPHSALYGSDAIGGVVQIFTRQASGHFAEVGAGGHDTREVSVGVAGRPGSARYNVSADRFSTDGINATRPVGPFPINEPDTDGYENDSISARLGYRFTNATDIEGHFLSARGHTRYDGDPNETDFVQQAGGVRLGFSPIAAWRSTLNAGVSEDDADNFKDGVFSSTSKTTRRTASWQNDFTLSDRQMLTVGVDYLNDELAATEDYTVKERDNKGAFAQHQIDFGRPDLLIALRRDDNEQFGTHDTGHAAFGYELTDALRARIAYGTAFRAPTFDDLYLDLPVFNYHGNPDLKPEESETIELGLSHKGTQASWEVNAYHTSIENLIVYDIDTVRNLNRATIDGLETLLSTRLGHWSTQAQVTWLRARDEATDDWLPRRARVAGSVTIEREIGRHVIGADVFGQGRRYDSATRLPAYGLINARYQRNLGDNLSMQVRLENVLDEDYELVSGYRTLGRTLFVSFAYRSNGK